MISVLVIFIVQLYRTVISPIFPQSCRYAPSCSQYTIDAFKKFSPFKAFICSIRRVVSCHPWSRGGYDPA
ncbi:MAG: membrane protein insertion efficiency factor YidD [Candidatus Neomarinimicrobiota bacterium]|nr:MAG: membrane protein insertion efficiency factor YidD [Candidatus Neomarinimicrobiota bacterium]HIA86205.1 membrane protein insertion efficiency factor YidD [Candidatus Neomarinimicrobiota bacterium]